MSGEHHGGSGPEDPGPTDVLNHAELLDRWERAARALSGLGVRAGSRVAVLLPMGLESVVVTLACVSLQAVRVSLAADEPPARLAHRLRTSGAMVVVTPDALAGDGRPVAVKASLERALGGCPGVRGVVVVHHHPRPVPWTPGRDHWWHELTDREAGHSRPYPGDMTSFPSGGDLDGGPPGPGGPDPLATPPARRVPLIFDDPLSGAAPDDTDLGWGERPAGIGGGDDLARFLDEKPPHHL
ncbi:AMP-binding protein [Streptomyces alkaliphilus]|uniref:AMP-binding protein n=1 Tax=Streptomyces alkaliphilus TaxID=1472722 RepID=A0A7W3TFW7_9ACTN|nr:AMP-binding protein [Streptomyces alkaliphilus]